MKQKPTPIVVFLPNETFLDSLYKDAVTAIVVSFCVYISQDNTFWTFVTGTMFLIFAFAKTNDVLGNTNKFKTKKDLQEWIDSLDDTGEVHG